MSETSENTMPKAYEPEQVENKWYPFWDQNKFFHSTVDKSKKPYSIVIPPPNVTGILTMGHVLNNTLQDILIRWRKMRGFDTCWFPGTDHAGIATETKVDRHLRETEGKSRDSFEREEFVKRVWQWKEEYGGTICRQLRKLGASCDWDRERFTMDEGLSRAVREVFVRLYEKGYIYRGRRMINWCPVSKTALSDEEVIYKEVHGYFYHIRYPFSDGSGHLVVATTRPETMLGDTAVAVHPTDPRYKGIIGKTVDLPLTGRKIPVITDEHANPEFGTGCVKITPAHDPNDFEVGQRHGLEILNVMNADGTMNEAAGEEYVGLDRFECREKVVRLLGDAKLMEKIEDHMHSVGYSERGDVPIEPRVSEQWFVRMDELAKPAIEAVRSGKIKFYPDHWTKTYFHWMENIKDWCISRQIWWGHRIPAWYDRKTGEIFVGMEAPQGDQWTQDVDVLDTWFSSWLWPFSIMGWPGKTPEQEHFYPTNDLVTGPDIIFFWVARMIMAGIEFKGEIPFSNVYFTSIIRDDTGRKLSKSLGNSPDPLDVIKTYGADALRFSIIYIAPVGMDIRYSNDKCELGRNFANKLWNVCRFRKMHGPPSANFRNLEGMELKDLAPDDLWIISWLNNTINSANKSLGGFIFHFAVHDIYEFVWGVFCDRYIESAKVRLNAGGKARENALSVLDFVLFKILRLLHPFMPFITEELVHQLGYLAEGQTIMTENYPESPYGKIPSILSPETGIMDFVEAKFGLVKAGRNLRANYSIPPGKKISYIIKTGDPKFAKFLVSEKQTVKSLLNAEDVEITDSAPGDSSPSILTELGVIYLPLEGVIDVKSELAKLAKQRSDIEKWINGCRAKLANETFISKAPQQLVEDTRKQLSEHEEKLGKVAELEKSLAAIHA